MDRKVNFALVVIGSLLLFVGATYAQLMAVVVTDDTPPYWHIATDGTLSLYPQDYDTITSPLTVIQAVVKDPESGVTSVVATIDATSYTLYAGFYTSIWSFYPDPAITLDVGSHSIEFVATNGVGLTTTYTGTFTVGTSMNLQGNWYINDILVNSVNQTLYFPTLTLNFKFVKTFGVVDSAVICTVVEGVTKLLTLTYQGNGTWIGSYKFAGGTHTLALKAYDGVSDVTMSLLNIDFGGITLPIEQLIIFAVGGTCIGIGGYGLSTGKKRRKP